MTETITKNELAGVLTGMLKEELAYKCGHTLLNPAVHSYTIAKIRELASDLGLDIREIEKAAWAPVREHLAWHDSWTESELRSFEKQVLRM